MLVQVFDDYMNEMEEKSCSPHDIEDMYTKGGGMGSAQVLDELGILVIDNDEEDDGFEYPEDYEDDDGGFAGFDTGSSMLLDSATLGSCFGSFDLAESEMSYHLGVYSGGSFTSRLSPYSSR